MVNEKEIYKEFLSRTEGIPIFLQPWWLETVSQKEDWNVALSYNKDKEINGVLPYIIELKGMFRLIRMKPLTPFLGPWISPYTGNSKQGLYSHENNILNQLINDLPDAQFFSQKFSPEIINWYPFFLKGFDQSTSYTYVLNNIRDTQSIWDGMKNTVRTVIRKADKNLHIIESEDISTFYQLQTMTFDKQNKSVPFSLKFIGRVFQNSFNRNQGTIFFAADKEGLYHAGLLLVWDSKVAYNLAIGVNTLYKNSGAVQLLIWHAINYASRYARQFNFEGSMLPKIEPIFRHFGGERTPYFRISKDKYKVLKALRILFKR